MPKDYLKSTTRFYSFYANDWQRTENPKTHVKSLRPFPDMDAAIEYAKKLIKRWKVESVRIINGASNEKATVTDDLDDTDYKFTVEKV